MNKQNLEFYSKKNKEGIKELKRRLYFVTIALIVFRIGSFIPIPVMDMSEIKKIFSKQQGTIIDLFNIFSGGSFSRFSIFSLGIMPYISSSIVFQFLSVINPKLIEIKKEGESGRQTINKYTRYGTLFLSILQSVGITISLPKSHLGVLIAHPGLISYFTSVISMVCGTIFLMWLGEQISEKGIGNGISIIIFSGIISGLPSTIINTIEQIKLGKLHYLWLLFIISMILIITCFVVFIERGQRKILVNYARRQQGRKLYISPSTHLPLKVNMAGVIPAIFASSIIIFPATILSWFVTGTRNRWLTIISLYLQPGKVLYMCIYTIAMIFFSFFYTTLVFNPRETADNLKKSGAFLPGIRPGEQTAKYINKIINRLTLFGSIYITFICLIPELIRYIIKVPFNFGGTSLLIVVVFIMDFMTQVQTLIMSTKYESVIKKVNLNHIN